MGWVDPVTLPDMLHFQFEELRIREDIALAAKLPVASFSSTEASSRSSTLSNMVILPMAAWPLRSLGERSRRLRDRSIHAADFNGRARVPGGRG